MRIKNEIKIFIEKFSTGQLKKFQSYSIINSFYHA